MERVAFLQKRKSFLQIAGLSVAPSQYKKSCGAIRNLGQRVFHVLNIRTDACGIGIRLRRGGRNLLGGCNCLKEQKKHGAAGHRGSRHMGAEAPGGSTAVCSASEVAKAMTDWP